MQVLLDMFVVFSSIIVVLILAHLYFTRTIQYQEKVATDPNPQGYHPVSKIADALFITEVAFIRALHGHIGEHQVKGSLHIPLILVHFYFTCNLLYFIEVPIYWDALFLLILATLALFLITSRVWAVYRMGRLLRFFKERDNLNGEVKQLKNEVFELYYKQQESIQALQLLIKKKQEQQQKAKLILHAIQKRKVRIKEHEQYLARRLKVVEYNLNQIYQVPLEVEIAIDTNVLMKCDQYLVQALQERGILISKRVQQEWDKNKTSADQQKAFRAREAIRRLISLENYRFVVSKWDGKFLQKNNLQIGVADDEIIADYLYEQQSGKELVILSDDNNFIGSAKVHLPILQLREIDLFNSN
ncbi:PIN domain-containing protein [Fredinandcohnia humi]